MTTNPLEIAVLRGLFLSEVRERLALATPGPRQCILYPGNPYRYHSISTHGLRAKAHRLAWTIEIGEIPNLLTIDHRIVCRRSCINTSHMEVVTLSENSIRGNSQRFPRVFS